MTRIAYYALHYGCEYLAWSIRSIQDAVDEIHILYAPEPSYGHRTTVSCPETEAQLKEQAHRFSTKLIVWHRGTWTNEGAHRTAIVQIAADRNADTVLAVDADELWDLDTVDEALQTVEQTRGMGSVRVRFAHFWRSFNHVCTDPSMPTRIIDMRHPDPVGYLSPQTWPVFHFGYAQSEATMRYKWQIHGHQPELRSGWLDRFASWKPGDRDVHPTNEANFWDPKSVEPSMRSKLEELLHDHPYWNVDRIS